MATTTYSGTRTVTTIDVSTRRSAEISPNANINVNLFVNGATTGTVTVDDGATLNIGQYLNVATGGTLTVGDNVTLSTQQYLSGATTGHITIGENSAITVGTNLNVSTTGTATVGEGSTVTINGNGPAAINTASYGTLDINGGTVKITNGGLTNSTHGTVTAENGGSFSVSGAVDNSTTGTITADSGSTVTINGAVNNATGGQIVIGDNSTFNAASVTGGSGGTIAFTGGHSELILGKNQNLTSLPTVTGFSSSSKIDLDGVAWSSSPQPSFTWSNGTLTIHNGSQTITWPNFKLQPGLTASDIGLEHESDGSLAVVCFLPGTMILTETGLKAVESISRDDRVVAYVDGSETLHNVAWVGSRRITPKSIEQAPVRIRAGALGDNLPTTDLLVTPEHCLLIDGRFVPARMLVNGRNIISDTSFGAYDVYHVETDGHSIINANGVLTESYLDTGNRASFTPKSTGKVVLAGIGPRKTWADAAAPLETARHFVEPVFRAIEARAVAEGIESATAAIETTFDDGLHIQTDNGQIISAAKIEGDRRSFILPAGVRSVRILSRTSRPSDVIGPFVDDRRNLGVLVGAITFQDGYNELAVTDHLTSETLAGWDVVETVPLRWTQGAATLELESIAAGKTGVLTIEIVSKNAYPVDQAQNADRRIA